MSYGRWRTHAEGQGRRAQASERMGEALKAAVPVTAWLVLKTVRLELRMLLKGPAGYDAVQAGDEDEPRL